MCGFIGCYVLDYFFARCSDFPKMSNCFFKSLPRALLTCNGYLSYLDILFTKWSMRVFLKSPCKKVILPVVDRDVYQYLSAWLCLCAVKPVVPRCSVPEAVTVGTSTELRCLENEGFPTSQYRWFHNNEELPQDHKNSPKFANSSYSINPDTGGLVRVIVEITVFSLHYYLSNGLHAFLYCMFY